MHIFCNFINKIKIDFHVTLKQTYKPDSPLRLVVDVMADARAREREASGAAVLLADGVLVDGGVGLGRAVVGRGDAVTGFTAIVAVPVVHSTVWVFICTEVHANGKRKKFSCVLGSPCNVQQ